MSDNRFLVWAAVVLGIIFLGISIMYFVEPASSLPLPDALGHQAGSSHHHTKHGIAALCLGIACLIFAWFQTEPKSRRTA